MTLDDVVMSRGCGTQSLARFADSDSALRSRFGIDEGTMDSVAQAWTLEMF